MNENLSNLKEIMHAISVPVFFKNAEHTFILCNPALENFFGLAPNALLGKKTEEFLPLKPLEAFTSGEQEALSKNSPFYFETQLTDKNKHTKHLAFCYLPLKLAESFHGILGIFYEKHARRFHPHEQESRMLIEQQAQAILESTSDVLIYLDAYAMITDTNKNIDRLGYTAKEILHRHIFELIDTPDLKKIDSLLKQAFSNPATPKITASLRMKTQSKRPLSSEVSLLLNRNDSGELTSILMVLSGLSAYPHATQVKEEKFEEMIHNLPCAILKVDKMGKIQFINHYATTLFEYGQEDVVGQNILGLLIPREQEAWDLLKTMLEQNVFDAPKQDLVTVFVTCTSKTGKKLNMEWSIRPMASQHVSSYLILSGNEVSSRIALENNLKDAKNQAEEANKAKSEFLANMSHEIRTPLNGIIGLSDIMFNKETDAGKKDMLDLILNSGKNLLYLINGILDLSRIESGRTILEKKEFYLSDAIQNVHKILLPQAMDKNLNFHIEYDPSIPDLIVGDDVKIRQILINLLGNAIKFTPKNGDVSLSVLKNDGLPETINILFEVKDTGIGIPQEKIPLIFNRFYQVDASRTRKFGGTGLGLSIVKVMVEMMQGKIHVASDVNKGSIFRVEIPFGKVVKSTGDAMREGLLSFMPTRNLKILVAEDMFLNQTILKIALEEAGHSVEIAQNGLEAFEKATSNAFDLIIMDVQMPILDGYEATRKLRAAGYQKKILAFTAFAMEGDRQKCLSAGMDDYLTKPIVLRDLHAKLAELFR